MNEQLTSELNSIWEKVQQAGVGQGNAPVPADHRNRLGVLVPIGMIGSGKTTVAKYFLDKGWLMAYEDMLINSFHGGTYDYQIPMQQQYLGAMREVAAYWLGQGYSVVVDSTNHTKQRRSDVIQRLSQVAGRDKLYMIAVEMPRREAAFHAQIRIDHDTRGYAVERWKNVAAEHESEYEGLSDNEDFDLIVRLPDVFKEPAV